jgi:hypothetical protein
MSTLRQVGFPSAIALWTTGAPRQRPSAQARWTALRQAERQPLS